MSQRSNKKSSRTPKIGEKKQSKKGLWIFVGVLFGLVAMAWVVDRARHQQQTDQEKEVTEKETFETLLQSNDYPKLEEIVSRLEYDFRIKKSSLPIAMNNINKRIDLTDRLLAISESEEDKNANLKSMLKLLLLRETHEAVENLKSTNGLAKLVKLTEANRDNPDREVQIELAMADLLLPLIGSYEDGNVDFKGGTTLTGMERMIDQNPDDADLAARMQLLCRLILNKNPNQDDYIAALRILEEKYSGSSFSRIRDVGRDSRVKRIMTTYRFPALEELDSRIPEANQKLLNGITTVLNTEKLDDMLARRLLVSCRRLEKNRAFEFAAKGYSAIAEKLKNLEDTNAPAPVAE